MCFVSSKHDNDGSYKAPYATLYHGHLLVRRGHPAVTLYTALAVLVPPAVSGEFCVWLKVFPSKLPRQYTCEVEPNQCFIFSDTQPFFHDILVL